MSEVLARPDPRIQRGEVDPEVLGDLGELDTGLTVPGDTDDVVAELFGARLGAVSILPAQPLG